MGHDAWLIVMASAMRAFGQGSVFVLIAIYLHLVGFNLVQIGLFLSTALAAAAVYTLSIVFVCDTLGRRRLLIAFAIILAGASVLDAALLHVQAHDDGGVGNECRVAA
jgi:MFS family permease